MVQYYHIWKSTEYMIFTLGWETGRGGETQLVQRTSIKGILSDTFYNRKGFSRTRHTNLETQS